MRTFLLILISCSIVPSYEQTTRNLKLNDPDYCISIVDSLKKAGYFTKAQQINLKETPIKANVSICSSSGGFASFFNCFEFLYSDSIGYMVNSRTGFKDKYLKFSARSVLFDLFSAMNINYLVDSTLLIKNPNYPHSLGEGGMSIYINIEFPDSKIIKKHLSFPWSSYAYCTHEYFENFQQYFENLQNLSFKPLDYGIAYYLNKNFTSEISRLFVNKCDYTFPRMVPLPFFTEGKIESSFKR